MKRLSEGKNNRGFTLMELLVALAVFLVISAAALSLFANHQPLFNRQQNLSALNITVRNAISQLQLDVVNAGTGYYPGTDIADWPVGITISNSNPTTSCNDTTTYTYSSTCFDTLNIITTDPNTPAARPDNGTFSLSPTADCAVTTTSPMYVYPPTGTTPAALASDYQNGDELLLVDSSNSQMTTIKLTAAPTTYPAGSSPSGVKLVFATTASNGTNTATNDPLGITTVSNTKLNTSFCAGDWIMRLAPITYQVDTSTASDPKLERVQSGTTSVVAEQVIGFKVGAIAWNTSPTDTAPTYSYNSSADYSNQWWYIRSVQISLIARTTPVTDPTYVFRNGFDSGPYQIESAMTVINPRNLTLNNN